MLFAMLNPVLSAASFITMEGREEKKKKKRTVYGLSAQRASAWHAHRRCCVRQGLSSMGGKKRNKEGKKDSLMRFTSYLLRHPFVRDLLGDNRGLLSIGDHGKEKGGGRKRKKKKESSRSRPDGICPS